MAPRLEPLEHRWVPSAAGSSPAGSFLAPEVPDLRPVAPVLAVAPLGSLASLPGDESPPAVAHGVNDQAFQVFCVPQPPALRLLTFGRAAKETAGTETAAFEETDAEEIQDREEEMPIWPDLLDLPEERSAEPAPTEQGGPEADDVWSSFGTSGGSEPAAGEHAGGGTTDE